MRIALIAPLVTRIKEPQAGGSQAFVADLGRGLAGRGHSIDVYAATGSEIEDVNLVDLGIDSELLIPALYRAGARERSDPRITEKAFATVYAHVADGIYDVVHNHAYDAPAISLASGLHSAVLHTLHLPPTMPVVEALLEAEQYAHPPAVATVSEFCAAAWRAFARIDATLRPHVPTSRIPWSDQPGEGAIFAGRLSPEKGAAEAIEIAHAAGLAIDVYGDPYDPDYVRRSIDPWRDTPHVRIHRALPRPELWEKMARASVVVCPVRWDEPFGMVAAEAQACGTPVVASLRGGLPENVIDGLSGLFVDPSDVDGASKVLTRALALSRSACRRHAETHLDLGSSLDAHEAIYAHLIATRGASVCA
ncbi:MAG: glycosyltransferase [Candidatus Dormibacteria bacterium]